MKSVATLQLPNAKDVQKRIKRHPNEVKAMHKQTGDEIRPDLGPLISILNETNSLAKNNKGDSIKCGHTIDIDKEKGILSFFISLPHFIKVQPKEFVWIEIDSTPTEIREEYFGKQLSHENRRPPGGLGQAPNMIEDINRNIHIKRMVIIGDKPYE